MRQLKISKSITNREQGALDKYLADIAKEPMISPDEEVELAQRIKQGDQIALDRLVRANLRFVVSVAKQYQNQGLGLADSINEGNVGLIKAAQRFVSMRRKALSSFRMPCGGFVRRFCRPLPSSRGWCACR